MHKCADLLALYEFCQIALLVHVEDDDRHVAFTAKSECCLVHHLETVLDRLVETEFLVLHCRRAGSATSRSARSERARKGSAFP